MTGTRGKRVKLSPTTHSPTSASYPIDPALTSIENPASPSYGDSPNVSPQPHASGSNGGQTSSGGGGGGDRAAERKERNRLAAQRSRDKRAAEFQAVAQECDALRAENEELRIKLDEKDHELRNKDDRIQELERVVATSALNGNSNGNVLGGGLSDLVHASAFLDQV